MKKMSLPLSVLRWGGSLKVHPETGREEEG